MRCRDAAKPNDRGSPAARDWNHDSSMATRGRPLGDNAAGALNNLGQAVVFPFHGPINRSLWMYEQDSCADIFHAPLSAFAAYYAQPPD